MCIYIVQCLVRTYVRMFICTDTRTYSVQAYLRTYNAYIRTLIVRTYLCVHITYVRNTMTNCVTSNGTWAFQPKIAHPFSRKDCVCTSLRVVVEFDRFYIDTECRDVFLHTQAIRLSIFTLYSSETGKSSIFRSFPLWCHIENPHKWLHCANSTNISRI